MHEERDSEFARYFSYLNLFAAFMLVLVLGANFLVMFVGWEGVGLCSYLLIGFWYQKKSASDAGKKAFIVNRIGDFGFILGVLLIFAKFGTVDFQEVAQAVSALAPEATFGTVSLITLLLFIGATGKSAQIPLYVWLPDAMEGPTPVSALIHAATMVTAGVYMIGRNAVLFSHAPETLAIIAIVGAATAFIAGTIGLVQNDIKRVLAYSTVSQLGYMFLAMGVGAYRRRHLPSLHPRVLQGAAVPRVGRGDSRAGRRAGPAAHGRAEEGAADHLLDVPDRRAGDCRRARVWPVSSARTRSCIRTYAGGHTMLWVVGLVTSLLTAIYMFRLVFLAFHGEPQRRRRRHCGSDAHDACGDPHRPRAGRPPARCAAGDGARAGRAGGRLDRRRLRRGPARARRVERFEQFLEPSLGAAARSACRARRQRCAEVPQRADSTELTLMAVSSARRARRHRHRGLLLPQATGRAPSGGRALRRPAHAAR